MQLKKAQIRLNKNEYQQYYVTKILNLEKRLEDQYKILFKSIKAWSKAKQSWLQAKKSNISSQKLLQIKERYKFLKRRFKCERKTWRSISNNLK